MKCFRRSVFAAFGFILCLLLLTACGKSSSAQTSAPDTLPPVTYTVNLTVGRTTTAVSVEEGTICDFASLLPSGSRLVGWYDEQGNRVDLTQVPIVRDCAYTAVLEMDLSNHVPYLFPDELGNARPKDALTGGELKSALEVLSADKNTLLDITFPDEEEVVTGSQLRSIFTGRIPAQILDAAFEEVSDEELTREQFAKVMNILTKRSIQELVVLPANVKIPTDVALCTEEGLHMMEAVLVHTPAEDGSQIADAVLDCSRKPGPHLFGGWLYYADENGEILRDTKQGTLQFGSDGRYTSGDEEVDVQVASLLNEFVAQNPQADPFDWLYTAFCYCRDNYKYVSRGLLEFGETGWELEWAKQMLKTGRGNCYNYAAVFWAMARGLGYDAYCISGYTSEDYEPHGWVQIDFEDGTYIFDPELAMAYLRDGKQYEEMFNMSYELAEQWPYFWP